MGPIFDPIRVPPPKLWVGNPQSKIASQIAAKQYQIQGWFVLTAYSSLPVPYTTAEKPQHIPYRLPVATH